MKKVLIVMVLFIGIVLKVDASELTGIMIDGKMLEGFDANKTSYDLNYPKDKENIMIGFTYDTSQYDVITNGELNLKLKSGLNVYTITVTNKEDESDAKTYTLNITREDGRSDDNTLSSLIVASKKVELDSNKTDYQVSVDNSLKTVEIKATLNNAQASFVDGYGERTGNNEVTLSSGATTIVEIRVKAENEAIRVYKITIVKSNYKSNDATLKDIKIKEKNFNFNSNTLEYNIEVENNIDKLTIEAIPNNTKANVQYDKEVKLKEGNNVITLEVTAEDGTLKTYKLNVTRKKEEKLVNNITIEDVDLEFQEGTYKYEIETILTKLNFVITLNSKSATYEILNNEDLDDGSTIKIVVTDKEKDKEETYEFIVNKPKNQIIDNNSNNNDDINEAGTNIGGSSFLKKYEMYIGLITFGVGLLSLLIAILLKPKGSQIM